MKTFNLQAETVKVAELAEEIIKNINENNIKKIYNFRIFRDKFWSGIIEVNYE